MDFTTIDFETANSFRGSPCSVGMVKVREGRVVDRLHIRMRPPASVDWFDPFNVSIHGITAESVRDAPRWAERLPEILAFIGDDVLVAHNAAFDLGVLRAACAEDQIPWPEIRFLCSLVVARRQLRLPSYRLPFVLAAYGQTLAAHHDALADAEAAATAMLLMGAELDVADLLGLAERVDVRVGWLAAGSYSGSVSIRQSSRLVAAAPNPDADPDGYLYGRVVVFTGALTAMLRRDAWEAVSRAGGRPEDNITKRTNVLVLGDFNPASLRPGADYSSKAHRAFALQASGQEIELMTEADFLQVIDG